MGLRKAWVYDHPKLQILDEEFDGLPRPSSSKSSEQSKHRMREGWEDIYTLTANGDLSSDKDSPYLSATSRARALRLRMKRTKHKRSNSLTTNHLDEKEQKVVEPVADANSKAPSGPPVLPSVITHKRAVSAPIIINTVQDLLEILSIRGLGSPTSPPSQTPTTVNSLPDGSTAIQTPTEISSPCKDAKEKVPVAAADRPKDVQSLISFFSAAPRPLSGTVSHRRERVRATAGARYATLYAFAAYHEEREKQMKLATRNNTTSAYGCGEDTESDQDSGSEPSTPVRRQTLGHAFVPTQKGRCPTLRGSQRKPIPTWS